MMVFEAAFFFAWLVGFIFGIAAQKYTQALVATWLGDATPRKEGRLTLNPIAHHEPVGLFLAAIIGLGIPLVTWGKTVNLNTYAIRGGRLGQFLVALSGVAVNLLLAFVVWIASKAYIGQGLTNNDFIARFLLYLGVVNILLATFNLIPLAPMAGWYMLKAVLPRAWDDKVLWMERYGLVILLVMVLLVPFFFSLSGRPVNPIFSFFITPVSSWFFELIAGVALRGVPILV